ncbi:MAG: hypothetical protein HY544_03450 [Candidatus Diapherotrites archaeon]|uniref:Uncharacterized protein n=1 Tax=Candidatus Iainarchaeum sp. TaxID=3101447 RepID=A0A8T3YJ35_9ARCH|nr:hypothetical protein [Candidatus Diapherotrites archaeon]
MAIVDFADSFRVYAGNFPTALSFSLLLVFVFPFMWLSNSFVSSGTMFISYGFLKAPVFNSLGLLALVLVFLFFYSALVCLMVLAVRRDLSSVKTDYYLREKIQKFAFKYFRFLAVFTLGSAIISSVLLELGLPVEVINIVLLVASSSFIFLPQTLVIDEEGLAASILSAWEYLLTHFWNYLLVVVFGIVAIFLVQVVEYLADYYLSGIGGFVSLILCLSVFVPFFEAMKTQIYMSRFDIIRSYESRLPR